MRREYRSFEEDGKNTQIELTTYPDEELHHAFFLREARDSEGNGITTAQRDLIFESLAEKYKWHGQNGIGPAFYVYSSEAKLWDCYIVGGQNGNVSLEFLERCPQYELEYSYDIQLARSKADFIAQGKQDIAYMNSLRAELRKDKSVESQKRLEDFEAFQGEYETYVRSVQEQDRTQ